MNPKIAIHETAFVTCAFRAWDDSLSQDVYAKLWPQKKTEEHAKRYAQAVSEHEPFAHSIRNRYFYQKIDQLHRSGKVALLINFGCGFSMYPFLMDENLVHIEIDQPDVIGYKKKKILEWQSSGKLPRREIHHIASDFNDKNFGELLASISSIKKGRPSFILIEGVLFFIGMDDTERLFELFNTLQGQGEFIGSVSFTKSLEETEAFRRLISFVEGNLEKNQKFHYQTVPHEFYKELHDYELIDHQDTLSLAGTYAPQHLLNPNDVLNEHMYLLKKQ
ncbi:MAG: class I SAM-dependent methyltransferase [Saonia sp.]